MTKTVKNPITNIELIIHLFTGLGVVCALFSLVGLYEGDAKKTLLWLLVSLVIDGVDGPLARKAGVQNNKTIIDGDVLDIVVDYLTFILIPALFMLRFDMFPQQIEVFMTAALLYVGAIWSARIEMKTEDKWFNGFPACWNFLAISLWLVGTSQVFNTATMILFIALTPTNIAFFHIFRSKQLRFVTVPLTLCLLIVFTVMVINEELRNNIYCKSIIIIWFVYYLGMAFFRTMFGKNFVRAKDQNRIS